MSRSRIKKIGAGDSISAVQSLVQFLLLNAEKTAWQQEKAGRKRCREAIMKDATMVHFFVIDRVDPSS